MTGPDRPNGERRGEGGSDRDESPDAADGRSAGGQWTVCPLCAVGCHLAPGESRSRASGVAGPSNPEGRLCRKGIGAFDTVAADERLHRPLVRNANDGRTADGGGVDAEQSVSWETALRTVVEGFEAVRERHGPDALAFLGAPHCTNEENYLLAKLARCLGTNNVDNRARLCHVGTSRTLAERVGWPATTNGLDDLPEADVILVVGANPAARQPVAFDSFVRPAVADGTTLVHVDPAGNETTRLADVHLAPRPGTDGVVLDLLSAAVHEAGGVDREFVAERTRGFESFAAGLAGYDRERALSVADVDAAAVDRVAGAIAAADGVAGMAGTGIDGHEGAEAPAALLDLLLLTGSLGRPGAGLFVLRGLVNEQGATDAGCVPDRLPGHQPVTEAAARDRVAAEWEVEPPPEPGMDAHDLLAAFGDDVRAALVVGENPAVSKRDPEWLRRRFEGLDLLVVVDVAHTGTTEHADVVLPAATGVEKAGTVTNLDRRVQRLRPTRSPPGAARSDFAVLRDLGRRLVGDSQFDYDDPDEAFTELCRVAPTHTGLSGVDLDNRGRRWPADDDAVLYRDGFDTPDGLAAFGTVRRVADSTGEDTGEGGGEDSDAADRLSLVTGGRHSDAGEDPAATRRTVRIHPGDAADRGVADGDPVTVSGGDATVAATARLDDGIRRGTAFLHAAVADPLLRCGTSTVSVAPRRSNDDAGEPANE